MGNKYAMIFFTLLIGFIGYTSTLAIEPNDLMNGDGLFLSSSYSAFALDNDHSASFITWNGTNVLKLQKPSGKEVSFKKGLIYTFPSTNITHIQFKFASSNPDIEDSNLRIEDNKNLTLILFRAGRGGLIRVNEKQMISFYNDSVSSDTSIKLTQVDLLVNWSEKTIEIFINAKYHDKCQFFQEDVGPVHKVILYNLYNSVSYWADLVLCRDICYSFSFQHILPVWIALILGFMAFLY